MADTAPGTAPHTAAVPTDIPGDIPGDVPREAADPVTRGLLAGLLTVLALLLPVRVMVTTTSYGAYYGLALATLAGAVGLGLLARRLGIPYGVTTVAGTVCATALLLPVALWLLAASGDPGGDGEVVLVAVPSTGALATVATVVLVRMAREAAPAGVLVLGLVGLLVGLGLAESAWGAVEDARRDAADVAALEASPLSPALVEVDGWEPELASITSTGGVPSEVSLRYSADTDDVLAPTFTLRMRTETPCEPIPDYLQCEDRGGYVVTVRSGHEEAVAAQEGSTWLSVDVSGSDAASLPDVATLGAALADARNDVEDDVEWSDVVALRD